MRSAESGMCCMKSTRIAPDMAWLVCFFLVSMLISLHRGFSGMGCSKADATNACNEMVLGLSMVCLQNRVLFSVVEWLSC